MTEGDLARQSEQHVQPDADDGRQSDQRDDVELIAVADKNKIADACEGHCGESMLLRRLILS